MAKQSAAAQWRFPPVLSDSEAKSHYATANHPVAMRQQSKAPRRSGEASQFRPTQWLGDTVPLHATAKQGFTAPRKGIVTQRLSLPNHRHGAARRNPAWARPLYAMAKQSEAASCTGTASPLPAWAKQSLASPCTGKANPRSASASRRPSPHQPASTPHNLAPASHVQARPRLHAPAQRHSVPQHCNGTAVHIFAAAWQCGPPCTSRASRSIAPAWRIQTWPQHIIP